MRQRVARSRELVAEGHWPSAVARVALISRQAIYRTPAATPVAGRRARPAADEVETAIVEVAEQNPTDGYRIVREWVCRKLGRQVNRKKLLRVMRERKLIAAPAVPDAAPCNFGRMVGEYWQGNITGKATFAGGTATSPTSCSNHSTLSSLSSKPPDAAPPGYRSTSTSCDAHHKTHAYGLLRYDALSVTETSPKSVAW